jgi:hypothetical protein
VVAVAKPTADDEVTRAAMRVLTRSRMIDGTLVSRKPSLNAAWGIQTGSDSSTFFYRLEDATVTPFGAEVSSSLAGAVAVAADQVLAAIVRDASAAQATIDEYERYYKVAVSAALHVGPFVCTGTLILPVDPFEKPGNNANVTGRIFPVRHATLRCLDAGLGVPEVTGILIFVHASGLEALSLVR